MAKRTPPSEARSRQAILVRLKEDGPLDANSLAAGLGVSPMAVRQHLYALQENTMVDYEEEPRPVGRPAKLWYLTPGADVFFPDGHADLTLGLITAIRAAFGDKGMDKLLAARGREQIAQYQARMKAGSSLRRKLDVLARVRSEEGYMAAVEADGEGGYLLVENHCPVCAAAKACSGLCANELEVFRGALGEGIEIERRDHILAGARRCAYSVRQRRAAAE